MESVQSFRDYLSHELTSRSAKNAHYSMRAFARDLEMAPSHLSCVLNGNAGLSPQSALKIAQKLNWSRKKTKFFLDLVNSHHARNPIIKDMAVKNLTQKLSSKFQNESDLALDEFNFISDWYHLAILEMFELKNFKMEDKFIADYLDIPIELIREAISRLVRLKLLQSVKGKLVTCTDETVIGDNVPSSGIRNFHKQLIHKALLSIENQNIEQRLLRTSILAIKKNKMCEALKMLQNFHEQFCEEIGENTHPNKDDLYCLSTQFFSLKANQHH